MQTSSLTAKGALLIRLERAYMPLDRATFPLAIFWYTNIPLITDDVRKLRLPFEVFSHLKLATIYA